MATKALRKYLSAFLIDADTGNGITIIDSSGVKVKADDKSIQNSLDLILACEPGKTIAKRIHILLQEFPTLKNKLLSDNERIVLEKINDIYRKGASNR